MKRVRALAHIDDRRRWVAYKSILDSTNDPTSRAEQRLAEMSTREEQRAWSGFFPTEDFVRFESAAAFGSPRDGRAGFELEG